jgi:RHS repeat-associated protein
LTNAWYGADATDSQSITARDSEETFVLDNNGNRLSAALDGIGQSYLPNDGAQLNNPMNRYESVGGAALSYDARGNTLSDGTTSYEYDPLNRMTAASGPGGDATYVYDALGRRLAKVVGAETTYFIYDHRHQVVEERSGSDQLLAHYTYGAALDEPITYERDGLTYYYHRDALGSVTEVSDAAGALVERYEYQVYGQVTIYDPGGVELPASAIGNPYLFTSQRLDPESGNYYFRARYYAPGLGRFLQMDPLGFSDGVNLYQYAHNQPTLLTDPTGLFAVKAGYSFKARLAAGPLPWPGTWWQLRVFVDAGFLRCCNQETGRTEVWSEMKIGIQLEAVFGKTIGKKLEKLPPDHKYFQPKEFMDRVSQSTDISINDQVKPCPAKGCKGFIEGYIQGKGGFGAGIKITLKFPIYPELLPPPAPEVTQHTGIMGIQISAGVKGGAKCFFRWGDVFELF